MDGWSIRPLVGFVCLLALAAAPGTAGDDPLQASAAAGGAVLYAVGGNAYLELGDGAPGDRSAIALPSGVDYSSLAVLDDGWAAAGSAADTAAGGRRLALFAGDASAVRQLPEPPGRQGTLRGSPVLLADGGRLAGAAWLEGAGERALAVRAATWDGGGWQEVRWVSRPGPGTQTALAGAVLADGSWLLAWSAFDGTDDEVVWSWRVGSTWTEPRRLAADNAVPDITPALVAAGSGALVAWSRYDGNDYRLWLARFERGEWVEARPAGGAGTLYPEFGGREDRPYLLFFAARPRAWTVAELTAAGTLGRRASIAPAPGERPVVTPEPATGVRMRWPGSGWEAEARWREVP